MPKSLLGPPLLYQNLSTCHDWPAKEAIVDLLIKMKEFEKHLGNNNNNNNNLLLIRCKLTYEYDQMHLTFKSNPTVYKI